MIKEKETLLKRLLMIIDIAVVSITFFAVYIFRQNFHRFYIFDIFSERQVIGELYPIYRYLNIIPILLFCGG